MTEVDDRLTLADWRRRVADLYTAVREVSRRDPSEAWELWRTTREALFRTHPQSPVPATARAAFRARHWAYDPALRFEVGVRSAAAEPAAEPATELATATSPGSAAGPHLTVPPLAGLSLSLPISAGGEEGFSRIGWVDVPFPGGERRLGVYWMAGYAGGVFLPFRDATNGAETYGAGRYLLDGAKSADLGGDPEAGTLVLDFNFAFHPSCAFDPRWSCPLAPPENRLDIRIEAGERLA